MLDRKAFQKVLESMEIGLKSDKVDELFRALDLNSEDRIDYEDFMLVLDLVPV